MCEYSIQIYPLGQKYTTLQTLGTTFCQTNKKDSPQFTEILIKWWVTIHIKWSVVLFDKVLKKKQEKAGDHSGQAVELCLRENCSSCLRQFIKQLLYDTQPLLISITWARFPSSILA